MECCNCDPCHSWRNNGAPDIKSRLTFYRAELIYDIETYSFVEGDVMPPDFHGTHQIFDIAQEGNADMVTRMFNLAHAECVEALYPFTKMECVAGEELDDTLVTPERYDIGLALPATFSRTTVVLLKELIHNYFVCRAIGEWLGMIYPDSRNYWDSRLEDIKNRMKSATMARRKRLRIKQSLF